MGKRLWGAILFLLVTALGAEAQYYAVNGACSLGGVATVTQGVASSGTKPLRGGNTLNGTGVMASYPGCTVTVYQTGTLVPAPIYLTASGSAQSNPFTGNLTDGAWVFFASAGCYDVMISSGATQASTMPNSKTFPGMCAGTGTGGGGGGGTNGTAVTVNGTAPVPNQLNFTNTLLVPGGSSVVNFLLNGNTVGAYVTGGGGGGGGLPTTPQYDLFASTGAGAAQVSGLKGGAGFLQGQVITATGDVTSTPSPFPSLPNASVEYFPQGAVFGGITVGAANGLAAYFSHSPSTGAGPGFHNGGLMLGGGNSSGTNYQVYVDCESSPSLACDFKVPLSVNGTAVGGGGGGGGLPTIPQWNLFASTGAGTATDSGVAAETGFLRAQVIEASGALASAPSGFTPPNGSIEYFPNGATYGGLNVGTLNGIAIHFSHSSKTSGAAGNGGVALAGGNATGVGSSYQIYLDCEQVGCDFKVPITYLGSGVGGGGGGGTITGATTGGGLTSTGTTLGMLTTCTANQYLSWSGSAWVCTTLPAGGGGVTSINTVSGAFNFTGAGVSCSGTTCTFTGTGGGGSGTVSSGTATQFAWYAATGTTVSSNAHLTDTGTTITSTETVAAPGLSVTGTGGIAMTGAGAALPAPVASSGGIGIGPGNVPQFYSNGGAWTNIGGGGGGATLPTIPATNLYASNGSGGAQDSNVQAMPSVGGTGAVGTGYIKSGASLVGGTGGGTSPFTGQNASQEWYGAGGTITPSTGSPVTFTNGAAVFMGHSASTAGATGDGGLALGGGSATPTSRVYLDCEVAGCDFKVPVTQNGSGLGGGGLPAGMSYTAPTLTLAPSGGVGGTLALGGATSGTGTIVAPSIPGNTNAQFAFSSGINLPTNAIVTWGTPGNLAIGRAQTALLRIGDSGTALNENGFIGSANSCALAAAAAFSPGTNADICYRNVPLVSRSWIVQCVLPYNYTSGTGSTTVTFSIVINNAPTPASTFVSTLWGGASPVYVTVPLSASGATQLLQTTTTLPDANIYTVRIDGVLNAPGGGGLNIRAAITTGAAQLLSGGYCRYE